jgi:hypothetical protein
MKRLTLNARVEEILLGGELSVMVVPFCPERLDLQCRFSISTGSASKRTSRSLAQRLVSAICAGRAYPNPRVTADRAGQEFVTFDINILGRTLNADLKRLGF